MIILFHAIYIVSRFMYFIISKSVLISKKRNDLAHRALRVKYESSSATANFDEDYGPRFFPPVYVQRYSVVKAALEDERWNGKIRKVVDFGCAEFGFFTYLKKVKGIQEILEVDIDHDIIDQHSCRTAPLHCDYLKQREEPLSVFILKGNIAYTDECLHGCDAVVCIELIEHLYPDVLECVPYTVFGYIKPLIAIFTTPNGEFNVLFPNSTGFRHYDHKFEWTRSQFECWARNIVLRYPDYEVSFEDIGRGPEGTEYLGGCSQMALFVRTSLCISYVGRSAEVQSNDVKSTENTFKLEESDKKYCLMREYTYPVHIDVRSDEIKIRDQAEYYIRIFSPCEQFSCGSQPEIPLSTLLPTVSAWTSSMTELEDILRKAGWELVEHKSGCLAVLVPVDDVSSCSESEPYEPYDWNDELVPETSKLSDREEDIPDKLHTNCSSEVWDNEIWDEEVEWDSENILPVHNNKKCISSSMSEPNLKVYFSNGDELLSVAAIQTDGYDVRTESESVKSRLNLICSDNKNTDIDKDVMTLFMNPLRSEESVSYGRASLTTITEESSNIQSVRSECSDNDSASFSDIRDFVKTKTRSAEYFRCGKRQCVEFLASEEWDGILSSEVDTESSKTSKSIDDLHSYSLSGDISTVLPVSSTSNDIITLLPPNKTCSSTSSFSSSNNLCLNVVGEGARDARVVVGIPGKLGNCVEMTESPLGESCSIEEPNDRMADSGYPNSASAQDMDLTPEQAEELFTENDLVNDHHLEHNEDSVSVSSKDSDSIEEHAPIALPVPDVLFEEAMNVENGDVANNNRDWEGNNAVAVALPNALDDLMPLLAAAEDLDNDNEIQIQAGEPFPLWLLNLLGLANRDDMGDINLDDSDEESESIPIVDEGLGEEFNVDTSLSDSAASEQNCNDILDAGSDSDILAMDPDQEVVPQENVGAGGEPNMWDGN